MLASIEGKKKKLCDTYALESNTEKVIELDITLSLGGAIVGVYGTSQIELMDVADRAMYAYKKILKTVNIFIIM